MAGAESGKIHWAAIARGTTVLAEAGEDSRAGEVLKLAKKILGKKATPGWEFDRSTLEGLRAVKFHVHETTNGVDYVWSVNCVYDASFQEQRAKGFVEKLVLLMEPLRTSSQWRAGSTLAAQESFAPTLMAKLEHANTAGKTAMVSQQVDELKDVMADNIELLLERGDKVESLQEKTNALAKVSNVFQQKAKAAKRFQLWQQAKFGLAVGTAAAATVGVLGIVFF